MLTPYSTSLHPYPFRAKGFTSSWHARAMLSLLLFIAVCVCSSSPLPIYKLALSSSDTFYWQVDYDKERVLVQVHVVLPRPSGWFAVGFSDYGQLTEADLCVFTHHSEQPTLQDTWTDDKGLWYMDEKQNCENFKHKVVGNTTKFVFTRKFETCDYHDYIIEGGTTHIVWLKGEGDLPPSVLSARHHGMARAELLKPPVQDPPLGPDVTEVVVTSDRVTIPSRETTYWCRVVKLQPSIATTKHHIVKFAPVIQEGSEDLVHHMELFHCEVDPSQSVPFYNGPCDAPERPAITQKCKKVLAAWAMGALPFAYPKEAGLPMGGPDFSLYVMLEVHYNNPEIREGVVDSSGMKVFISGELRKYDAGVIELGLEYIDKMAIPPGETAFPLTGYCIAECTAVTLPQTGILIFASQLHTHLTGVRVLTQHVRQGLELPELNRDNHYSTHYQEIRHLHRPTVLLPGDALMTTCWYNTESRQNMTLGGFAITDEMCVNYIYYYPKIDLEVCKSSISNKPLANYFETLKRMEKQETGGELPISVAYGGINWTPLRSAVLGRLYDESPIYMQCNKSSGDRFPGVWDQMPTTKIHHPLTPLGSVCDEQNYI